MRVNTDVLLGVAVVAVMSGGYVWTGAVTLGAGRAAARNPIVPVLTCVARDPVNPGNFIATFGYQRADGAGNVRVPYAAAGETSNYVEVGGRAVPDDPAYGFPSDFEPGTHPAVFSVRAPDAQTVTWRLKTDQARQVKATSQSLPVCGPGQIR